MEQIINTAILIFQILILIYTIWIVSAYIILAVISGFSLKKYLNKNRFANYTHLLSYPLAPSISIIAPAYNESLSIVENIRALLSLYYPNFEVVVINDHRQRFRLRRSNPSLNGKGQPAVFGLNKYFDQFFI